MRRIDLENEAQFEDLKVEGKSSRANQSKFYWTTEIERESYLALIRTLIAARSVLEIGCSSGSLAAELSPLSGSYVGIDISSIAIDQARKRQLPRTEFLKTDGHSIPFQSDEFDCVIVDALLHHMDLESALSEIKRVLKPGGILFFNEPLGTNPLINLYRKLTPSSRTVDERPFTREDLKLLASMFEVRQMRFFGFSCLLSALIKSRRLRSALTSLDRTLEKTPLKSFFWQFAGVAEKTL